MRIVLIGCQEEIVGIEESSVIGNEVECQGEKIHKNGG